MPLQEGYTLMHEHITINLSKVKKDEDCILDCFEETVKELKVLYKYGVRNIVDVTNSGMGRNPEYVTRVEEETGIHILQSTGFYKEPFLPENIYHQSEEELVEFMKNEILEGIDSKKIYAEMIGEIGTSKNVMEPMEEVIFRAAAKVSNITKTPIYTHTTLGTYALEQAKFLIELGVNPKRIVIGHIDLCGNLNYIKEVLNQGIFVGFDTIGKNDYFPDVERAKYLVELEKLGLLNQVVLSMDLTRKSHLTFKGGIGYAYIFEKFIPMLTEQGMTDESIQQMLKLNPKEIFKACERV